MNERLPELMFDASNIQKYKVEINKNCTVYAKKVERNLTDIYYLVFWKGYLEKVNTWEPSSTVMHLRKIISTFHKDYLKKSLATSFSFNSAPPMTKPSIKLSAK